MPLFLFASLLTAIFTLYPITRYFSETPLESNVGTIRAAGSDIALLRGLRSNIPRGSDLFVFPYLPIAYFLTLSQNPTRYSYLQPGMMSDADESAVLTELRAAPPTRVLYYNIPEEQILRIWPHSDPTRLRMRRIEAYLAEHYKTSNEISYQGGSFRVMERRPVTAALQ
ncbi:MAG: hypothetical protein ABIR70_04610 [Bryobacteraceae bacterium]